MKFWPHAPLHAFNEKGTYMVTAATYNKIHHFKTDDELDFLHDLLLQLAEKYQWRLEAWAVFSNHYHFIAQSPDNPLNLSKFIAHLHAASAKYLNALQGTFGRKIWYRYWDSKITFQNSYLPRLKYIMNNPVKHKIVQNATQYRWCSARWFENNTSKAYCNTVLSLNTDTVNILDDF